MLVLVFSQPVLVLVFSQPVLVLEVTLGLLASGCVQVASVAMCVACLPFCSYVVYSVYLHKLTHKC